MLAKLGYKPGQGLGKTGEGKVNPVQVQILPAGKSLDFIMNRRLNLDIGAFKCNDLISCVWGWCECYE